MKRLLPLLALAACFAFLVIPVGTALAQGPNFPEYQGFVNDYAGLLSPAVKTQLDAKLSQLEKDTTAEVAVVTVKSLEGDSVDDYAVRLFEKWKIGKKDKDNGVLFLVALDDRKMRIEVGYGLEPLITDGRAGRIRDNDVIPRFKDRRLRGWYNGGGGLYREIYPGWNPTRPAGRKSGEIRLRRLGRSVVFPDHHHCLPFRFPGAQQKHLDGRHLGRHCRCDYRFEHRRYCSLDCSAAHICRIGTC